jgi:hypothetical protein
MKTTAITFMLLLILSPAAARADVPGMINFQGTLTDEDGVALDTTLYIAFEIYTDSTGGTRLWGESQSVTVTQGVFSVLLGSQGALADSIFSGASRWLAIRVEDDPEMAPRQRIVSSAYAIHASQSDTAEYARSASAADDGDWSISGVDLSSAVSGNVGVGTGNPGCKLDVVGDGWRQIRAKGTDEAAAGAINVVNDLGEYAQFALRGSGAASYPGDLVIGPYSQTEDLHLGHGNFYPKMTITPAGRVGIGVTAPISMLDVRSPAAIADYFRGIHYGYDGDDGGVWISTWDSSVGAFSGGSYYHNAGQWTAKSIFASAVVCNSGHILFYGNSGLVNDVDFYPTERMRITNVGNVGIGTTGPASKLEVAGTVHSTSGGFKFPDGSTQTSASSGDGHSLDASDGNPEDVVYVDADGEVGIGTTGPNSRLTVQAQSSTVSSSGRDESDFVARIKNMRDTDGYGGLLVDLNASPSATNDWPLDVRYDGATKFIVRGDGNVGVGVVSPSARLDVHHDQDALSTVGFYNTNISSSFDAGIQLVLGDNNGPPKLTLRQSGDGTVHNSYISHVDNSSSHLILENQNAVGHILMKTNSGTRMSIDENGDVGIGTTSPSERLEVAGNVLLSDGTDGDTKLKIADAGGNSRLNLGAASGAVGLMSGSHLLTFLTDTDNNNTVADFIWGTDGTSSTYSELMRLTDEGVLEVSDTVQCSSGGFKFPDGTVQTSASGADGHSLDAADGSPTDAVYVDNSGNVGIGTTSPSQDLHVEDTQAFVEVKSTSGYAGVIIDKASTTTNGYLSYRTDGNVRWTAGLQGDDNYRIFYWPTSKNALYIKSTGEVGLGTTSPLGNLHIYDSADPEMLFDTDGTDWHIGLDDSDSDKLKIGTGTTIGSNDKMVITTGGYVGIGTNNPSARLEVDGSIWIADSSAHVTMHDGAMYRSVLGVNASNTLGLAGGFSTLYVPNNVGIGTNTPAYKLDVNTTTGTAAHFLTTQSSSSAYGCLGQASPGANIDAKGVYGLCDPADFYGYGVYGDGGYHGVHGQCIHSTTGHTAIGVYGYASGGTNNYGVYYSGGLGGSGSKSAIVRTEEGPMAVYCQESPENWFEDFGSGEIRRGRADVQLAPDYLLTVTIDGRNPMKVFITPNADIGRWWVEKGTAGFVLMAPEAPEGARFDYRVVAKRWGYEDVRLQKVTAAYADHFLYPDVSDVPLQYRQVWLKSAAAESPSR